MLGNITVFCDGLCEPYNPGGTATYGFVIYQGKKEDRKTLYEGWGIIGSGPQMTNNIAEYTAAIEALKWLKSNQFTQNPITLKSDSQLLVNQLNGIYAVRSPRIRPLFTRARKLMRSFKRLKILWVPREQNKRADLLSRKAYAEHLQATRLERAKKIPLENIKQIGPYKYAVSGHKNRTYIVDLSNDTCSCPDFQKHQKVTKVLCKHILAVKLMVKGELEDVKSS